MRTKTAAAIAFATIGRQSARTETVVERLRQGIAEAGLDCGCRETANNLVDKLSAEEDLIKRSSGLAEARRMRDAILIVTALLGELDDLMPDEPDRTAFHEIASLFQDVAEFASCGAEAATRAAGGGNS
jgi:hypothetical protein